MSRKVGTEGNADQRTYQEGVTFAAVGGANQDLPAVLVKPETFRPQPTLLLMTPP